MVTTAQWFESLRTAPKLVCFARTFPKHAKELGNAEPAEPIFFLKSPSAVIGDHEEVRIPDKVLDVQHEAEIAVILKKGLRAAPSVDLSEAVLGYCLLNDITARDIQKVDGGRFSRAKSYPSFCPLASSFVEVPNWQSLHVTCHVNGELRQSGRLVDMSWTPEELLSWLSFHLELNPGDVVSFGTPAGVGSLITGDVVELGLHRDGIRVQSLTNRVC